MSVDWARIANDSLNSRPQLKLHSRLKLPVLPQAVIAFTELADDPNASPRQLAAALETDSSLTSELLKQINSAAMGLKQQIGSVTQAINMLGPRRTKMLVLTSALQTATRDSKARLIHNLQFQRQNFVRALFARETARVIGADPELAYIAALLQDFILPLLTEAFYDEYVKIIDQTSELIEKEREVFGWDHASVAASLAREWRLPDELVACISLQHDIERVLIHPVLHHTSLAAVVAASNLPDSLNQTPAGFEALLVLQDAIPEFSPLEIAVAVDEELARQGQESTLFDRLNELALSNLEQRRSDRIHRYKKLGNYLLEDQIGEGGMGVVYRANHCMLKRPAAIKLLHAAKVCPESLVRFEREVQLTCGLTSPHTVAVYDYGVTAEGLFYYVMELLEGITLAQLVQIYGPQPAGRVIHFLRQACLSLTEAHGNGLIHRDLKPENLMICRRGGVPDTLKVLDFGLARMVTQDSDPSQSSLAGTPRYMSPEAITAGDTIDARSDLYSLGAVGYFLLTGHPVFPGKDVGSILKAHVTANPIRPSVRLGSPIDRDLEDIIMRCLEKSRDRRPSSAQELNNLLAECQTSDTWSHSDSLESTSDLGIQINKDPKRLRDSRDLSNSKATCQMPASLVSGNRSNSF